MDKVLCHALTLLHPFSHVPEVTPSRRAKRRRRERRKPRRDPLHARRRVLCRWIHRTLMNSRLHWATCWDNPGTFIWDFQLPNSNFIYTVRTSISVFTAIILPGAKVLPSRRRCRPWLLLWICQRIMLCVPPLSSARSVSKSTLTSTFSANLKTTLHKSWWFTNFFFSGTILRNSSADLAVPHVRDFCPHITHVYIFIFTNLNT